MLFADLGFYRDATGALKRQATRFRVYGLNGEGQVVAELTAADAEIRWRVMGERGLRGRLWLGAPNELGSPHWLARLASDGRDGQEMRHVIANHFRVFERDAWSPTPWAWLYGDAMNIPAPPTPRPVYRFRLPNGV
jgi:hypothetical protein